MTESGAQAESRVQALKDRSARILDRVEAIYLKILRGAILIIATGLIIYAAGLAVYGLYHVTKSPDSVEEEVAKVDANELTSAELTTQPARSPGTPRENPAHRRGYGGFLNAYFQLFQRHFEPFRQSSDAPMERAQFNNRFFDIDERIAAIARGQLNYEGDMADLRTLLEVMTAAATLPESRARLQRYRAAQRVEVCENVERTRTTYEASWDPFGTTCPNWMVDMGCASRRPVQSPYTARECSMRFPEGTQSHAQIFRAFQDRYFGLLRERREANAACAQQARLSIVSGIAQGEVDLWFALQVLGAFLILMFFFLLIAIERHQRKSNQGGVVTS